MTDWTPAQVVAALEMYDAQPPGCTPEQWMLAALRAAEEADQPRYRHAKRGTEYRLVARATLQTSVPLSDYAPLIIYQGDNKDVWARSEGEFFDGRFELIEPSNSSES